MKIYPSNHKIKSIPQSKIDTDLNIPLAYVDIDFTKYKIDKTIDSNFLKNQKRLLVPEEVFDNKNFKLFNKNEEEVRTENLFLYKNNKYVYYPTNMIKFAPKNFQWRATVQKNLDYKISNNYNINIAGINNEILNQNLITAFMNPSERNMLVYKNIKINNNSTARSAFTNMSTEEMDIAFIKSHNCKYYDIDETLEIKPLDFLNKHTNIWFGCEDATYLNKSYNLLISSEPTTFNVAIPTVSQGVSITSKYYFDTTMIDESSSVTVHNIFDSTAVPILILEYKDLGFIILSSYEILDNPLDYEAIMYDVMMYVYLHSYKATKWNKEWISYNVPDYEYSNNQVLTKTNFLSSNSINAELNIPESNLILSKLEITNDTDDDTVPDTYALTEDNNNIKCIGQNNGHLMFALDKSIKVSDYSEVEKPAGWKSIYKNGYIYYLENLHYMIEMDITGKVLLLESNNSLLVKIYGFKSSKCNINKQSDTSIQIPFIKTTNGEIQRVKQSEYVFSIKDGKIEYSYIEDYKDEENKYKLFNIMISQTDESTTIYDMRQLGGGLPEDEPDNYELFDIGHINGRPYRIAGTLVLTMPTKYKPYEDYIKRAIDKFKTAEDYIAIIFEDEEE